MINGAQLVSLLHSVLQLSFSLSLALFQLTHQPYSVRHTASAHLAAPPVLHKGCSLLHHSVDVVNKMAQNYVGARFINVLCLYIQVGDHIVIKFIQMITVLNVLN